MHAIMVYGSARYPLLFHKVGIDDKLQHLLTEHIQAILQSSGFVPMKGNLHGREQEFKMFMTQANCSDVVCLWCAMTQSLMDANNFSIHNGTTGDLGFTVVVDGDYIPDLPDSLLLKGRYHKTLALVIIANNAHEVFLLVEPFLNSTLISKDMAATFSHRQRCC